MGSNAKANLAMRALVKLGYPSTLDKWPDAYDLNIQNAEYEIPVDLGRQKFAFRLMIGAVTPTERRIYEYLDYNSNFDDFPYKDVKKCLLNCNKRREEYGDILNPNLP